VIKIVRDSPVKLKHHANNKFWGIDRRTVTAFSTLLFGFLLVSCQFNYEGKKVLNIGIEEEEFLKMVNKSFSKMKGNFENKCFFVQQFENEVSPFLSGGDVELALKRLDSKVGSDSYVNRCKEFDWNESLASSRFQPIGSIHSVNSLGVRIYLNKASPTAIRKWINGASPDIFKNAREKIIRICNIEQCDFVNSKILITGRIEFSKCNTVQPEFMFFDGRMLEFDADAWYRCLTEPLPLPFRSKP
jgi:hypothetical protein